MSYFNDDQNSWMRYLASLKPEEKCACGWNRKGECYNCDIKTSHKTEALGGGNG